MSLATVGAVVGIGSAAYSMYNQYQASHGGPGQGGGTYVPTDMPGADQRWQDYQRQMQGWLTPGSNQLGYDIGDAYAGMKKVDPSGYGHAADMAGQQYGNLAGQQVGYGNQMAQAGMNQYGQANNLYGAGNQLWQTAQDPQQALYNQMHQQTVDASRAGTSARGIGMSGNAAGIENQDVNNFNMQWQNQQLGRQLAGAQGMAGMYSGAGQQQQQGGNQLVGAAQMGQGAAGNYLNQGQVPYSAYNQIAQQPMNNANMYAAAMSGGVYNPLAAGAQGQLPYMTGGNAAGNAAFNQNQQNWGQIGYGINQLGNQFRQGNAFGGYNPFAPSPNQGSNWSGGANPDPYYPAGGYGGEGG